jgi:hypothetical protein
MARVSSDFPPEYGQLYNTALTETVKLDLSSDGVAINLQHQLHTYRRLLVSEGHPLGAKFQEIAVRRKGNLLILENRMSEIQKALGSTKLVAPEPDESELDRYMENWEKQHERKD